MQPGGPNLQNIVLKAQQMQAEMERAQAALADAEITGSAGGGLVTAVVNGNGELTSVTIDPSVVDPEDIETLGDLIVAAVRDATREAREMSEQAMGSVTSGLSLDALGLGGLGLGGPGLDGREADRVSRDSRGPDTLYEGPVQDLIDELGRLPGIGPKSAQRIAFHLLTQDSADITRLQGALQRVKDEVRFCDLCGNVSEGELCRICGDSRRDAAVICVVEEPKDVAAIERTREFRGKYHVLGGAISPIDGIGPDQLRIAPLLVRIAEPGVSEVILATDPNLEGEATATYLTRLLRNFPDLSVTRLASGLPVGGDLEYADEVTLGRAFSGRRAVDA